MECYLCGRPIRPGEGNTDHVIPKSRGGRNYGPNLKPVHRPCNSIKGNLMPDELVPVLQQRLQRGYQRTSRGGGGARWRRLLERIVQYQEQHPVV